MAKTKVAYVCNACGAQTSKWAGQCADCGEWNTLTEFVPGSSGKGGKARFTGYAGNVTTTSKVLSINEIQLNETERQATGSKELDHVLGGGLVEGSVVLVGGDPGIGKSTLLLQPLLHSANKIRFYMSLVKSPCSR